MGCGSSGSLPCEAVMENQTKFEKSLRMAMANPGTVGGENRSLSIVVPSDVDGMRQLGYTDAEHTLIVFDWDDTFFPRTWEREALDSDRRTGTQMDLRGRNQEELDALQASIANVLSAAMELGQVAIVTNASPGWIADCCKRLLPELQDVLFGIHVEYAIQHLNENQRRGQKTRETLTQAKARAMLAVVSMFEARGSGRRAQNIVSIGDGRHERDAVKLVAQYRSRTHAAAERCFAKTIKMIDRPSLASIIAQLSVLSDWLPGIVEHDSSISVDFSGNGWQEASWPQCPIQMGDSSSRV